VTVQLAARHIRGRASQDGMGTFIFGTCRLLATINMECSVRPSPYTLSTCCYSLICRLAMSLIDDGINQAALCALSGGHYYPNTVQ